MSEKVVAGITSMVVVSVFVTLFVIVFGIPLFVFAPYDGVRLALFAHRIADADRVVGTIRNSSVTVTFSSEDTKKLVRAVRSARSVRTRPDEPLACSFSDKATFYKGTNEVGSVLVCGSVFLIDRQSEAFNDESRGVETAFSNPLHDALKRSYVIEAK